MNDTACCAHSRVVLRHQDYASGTRSDYWECESGCGKKFWPETNHKVGHIDGLFEAMSIRDYFAAAALTGLLSNDQRNVTETGKQFCHIVALGCYNLADAMLAEREKGK